VSRELSDARGFGERPTVQEEMAAEGLGREEWEVGLREAQSASYRDLLMAAGVERGADSGDLSLEPVDELDGIAPWMRQSRRSETGGADLDLAFPVFGVDDPDVGRCDGDVVDVSAAGGHAAVVQGDDAVGVGSYRQRVSDGALAKRALAQRGFMLRGALEGEKQSADAG